MPLQKLPAASCSPLSRLHLLSLPTSSLDPHPDHNYSLSPAHLSPLESGPLCLPCLSELVFVMCLGGFYILKPFLCFQDFRKYEEGFDPYSMVRGTLQIRGSSPPNEEELELYFGPLGIQRVLTMPQMLFPIKVPFRPPFSMRTMVCVLCIYVYMCTCMCVIHVQECVLWMHVYIPTYIRVVWSYCSSYFSEH